MLNAYVHTDGYIDITVFIYSYMHAAVWYIMDTHAQIQRVINDYNNTLEMCFASIYLSSLRINLPFFSGVLNSHCS